MTKDHMTAEERAMQLFGGEDNFHQTLRRLVIPAIREAENAAYEKAAEYLEGVSRDWLKFGEEFPEDKWVYDYACHIGEGADHIRFLKHKDTP